MLSEVANRYHFYEVYLDDAAVDHHRMHGQPIVSCLSHRNPKNEGPKQSLLFLEVGHKAWTPPPRPKATKPEPTTLQSLNTPNGIGDPSASSKFCTLRNTKSATYIRYAVPEGPRTRIAGV